MQIIHDFRQVFLCLILSCYILKMNALGGRDIDLGLIAAHAEHHGVASGPLHEFPTEILANGKKISNGRIQVMKKLTMGDISSLMSCENTAPDSWSRSTRFGSSIMPVL